MNSVPELIHAVESLGGRFMIDGGRLGIVPATAAATLIDELRRYKPEIIELLAQRPAMPASVRLVSWNPKNAPVQLSPCETVVDSEKFIRTTLIQIDARLHDKNWLAGNWPLSGLVERLAAVGCVVELVNRKVMLQ
jgi:hypothetical protein